MVETKDIDPCLYMYKKDAKFSIAMLDIDDILLMGLDDRERVRDFERKTIILSQAAFFDKILQRFGFTDCRPLKLLCKSVRLRVAIGKVEKNDYFESKVLNRLYRKAFESLFYLASAKIRYLICRQCS